MKAKMTTALLLGMLLLAGPVAADDGPGQTVPVDVEGCPIVDILLYYPYVAVHPQCIPDLPPGQD